MAGASRRYGQTVWLPKLQGGSAVPLRRRRLEAGTSGGGAGVAGGAQRYDEDWLQELLFKAPEILPLGEIDSAFAPAVSLCRELPTAAGPLDLACMSEGGRLTLVECKLWRNPEARREVVAQILDYAKEISRWTYDELNDAVARAARRPRSANTLFDLVQAESGTLDEAAFVDDVTRGLLSGQFLLIVVGDGIHEGVERLAEYLQQHAGIAFTFALVELAIFDMPEGAADGVIVEPRVLARTREIERAVVRRADEAVVVEPPPPPPPDGRVTLSEFDSTLRPRLEGFFGRCRELGLEVTESKASLILHWRREDGRRVNFGTLFPKGELNTNYVVWNAEQCDDPQVGVAYLAALAQLLPGAAVKKDGNYWTWRVVVAGGRLPRIADALAHADEWLAAIERTIAALNRLAD